MATVAGTHESIHRVKNAKQGAANKSTKCAMAKDDFQDPAATPTSSKQSCDGSIDFPKAFVRDLGAKCI
jgi:hypothetical protein